jgi:type III restriction enzyme
VKPLSLTRRGSPLLSAQSRADAEGALIGDDKREAAENEEAARLWINGIEALDHALSKGVRSSFCAVRAIPKVISGSYSVNC